MSKPKDAMPGSQPQVVQCADCKYWLEKNKGWGQCSEVAKHDHIRVLGGVWWPQKTFGCIFGKAKRKPSTLNDKLTDGKQPPVTPKLKPN